ncbi:unnamed protein product [Strongylus vulgaris]|uniref:Uncharacterized protein n=1 Tax=Strongylus vulgaris TaxID=40348 RepID=A0A3P7JSH7_STRVU|nr:unnamed protein product [Strongylus vulgaris]
MWEHTLIKKAMATVRRMVMDIGEDLEADGTAITDTADGDTITADTAIGTDMDVVVDGGDVKPALLFLFNL